MPLSRVTDVMEIVAVLLLVLAAALAVAAAAGAAAGCATGGLGLLAGSWVLTRHGKAGPS